MARQEVRNGGRNQQGSSLALRSTPNKQLQRVQQRKSHSPYPKGSPRTPVRRLAQENIPGPRTQPQTPQSPAMRAIASILGYLSPFSSTQVKSSAAFGDPEESVVEDSEHNTLNIEDDTTQDANAHDGEDEEMAEVNSIYPALPQSSFQDSRDSSGSNLLHKSSLTLKSPRQSAFTAPRHSTPSRDGFNTYASTSAQKVMPPSSPVFTFGRRSNADKSSSSPALPAYPRAKAQSKATSPLAKNYDLLARFFAEKAEQEAKGRSGESAVSLQSGEVEEEEIGLTEIEVAGCLKLIEESLGREKGRELEQLQESALERVSNARVAPTFIDTSRYDRSRLSRSPSLPLGAAAGELSGTYGLQSRPSSSFLSPAYPRSDDAQINRSLASTFSTSSAPLKRRHRPLYLGPGQGASAASNMIKRNQQIQQQRRNYPNRPLSNSRSFVAPSWQRKEVDTDDREASGSNVKRRRVESQEKAQVDKVVVPAPPTILSSSQSMPSFLFDLSPPKVNPPDLSSKNHRNALTTPSILTKPQSKAANHASPSPAPSRTATADVMLSILSSGPSIPIRRTTLHQSNGENKPAEDSLAPEVVNPYQTRSRIAKRDSLAVNSASLISKEKERLKEEREKKQKAVAEAKKSKESTLEMIERTAPTRARRGGLRKTRSTNEEAEEIAKKIKEQEEEEKKRQARELARQQEVAAEEEEKKKKEAEQDRKEKEEQKQKRESVEKERQRKTEEVKKRMEQLASQSAPLSSSSSTSSASASESPMSAATPATSNMSRKSMTFGSTFAPKKPSPLSQADSMAPDSPSSSSEHSERETIKPISFNTPNGSGYSFSSPALPKPTEVPLETPKETRIDARQEALTIAPSALPKFDFTASIFTRRGSDAVVNDAASRTAMERPIEDLPEFELITSGSKVETGLASIPSKTILDPIKPASTFSFASSAASSMDSTPLASTSVSDAEGDNDTDSASREKSVSALLSGVGEGEEDEECLHEVRSKIWNLKEGKWNDLGIGLFRVKKDKGNGKKRILVRNEGNGKVMVNFRLMKEFKTIKDKNVVSFLGFDSEGKPSNYRCKVKTNDMAEELADILKREALAA